MSPTLNSFRSTSIAMAHAAIGSWKDLSLTDVATKVIAFVVLTPLVGILIRGFMALSGKSFLADEDILYFFLGPIGWISLVVIGGVSIAILALEQAALLGIIRAAHQGSRLRLLDALRFAVAHAWSVWRLTARVAAIALLTAAPFLLVSGFGYIQLLGEHDINYYLSHRPPDFVAAVSLGAVMAVLLISVLLFLAAGWFQALPIVLFESVQPADALRLSRQRTAGHRRKLLTWIVGWLIATMLTSAAATTAVGFLARIAGPNSTSSFGLLLFAVGVTISILAVVNLVCNLLSSISFAILLFHLYLQLGGASDTAARWLPDTNSRQSRRWLKLTTGRAVLATVLGVTTAMAVGAVAILDIRLEDDTEITAHRGASAAAPENTLAAVRRAIEEGADWVEIDVQETADGEVVVFHDSDFKRLASNSLKIWDATMVDLQTIDIGSWFAPEFHDERVPTLEQVLDICQGRIRVNIELKYYGHDQQLEQRVVDIVEAHGMESDIVIMSLKTEAIRKTKAIRPEWTVGLLTAVKVGDLMKSKADFLAVSARLANRSFVRSAQAGGKQVQVWTVNDAVSMSTMIGRGVDNIISDKPGLAKSVLKQRAELSVAERLLLELAVLLGVSPEFGEL